MTAQPSAAWPVPVGVAPDVLADIQADFARQWQQLVDGARANSLPPLADKRFAGAAWRASPQHLLTAHAYLLSVRTMMRMVDAAQGSEALRARLRFAAMQWLDAVSPANFLALNPEAQAEIAASGGKALEAGIANLLADLRKGRITQTDERHFELGRNVAITPGQVIFENALFQLIQYHPQTAKVHARPLVIVPPNINKFYILDLQPANSFVQHAVQEGFTVFMVSWRNPLPGDGDDVDRATWDDYLENAVLRALQVASEVSGQKQVNALGFCVGGTMLACALAIAAARGQDPVASLTLLTALLDFHDTGVLGVFVDEHHAQLRDAQLGAGGLMPGRELAATFSFLRPNELVWNYVVGNYLQGKTPPAFDLLFWNADGTNLPGPFFTWYFRNTYLQNNLKVPGRCEIGGVPMDLTRLRMPAYIFGSREDHIVPWQSAYASTQLLRGPLRFVLGASGHVAGVINPPARKKRSYWALPAAASGEALPGDPGAWLAQAPEHAGSWWPDWTRWLRAHAGRRVNAPARAGNDRYLPIEPAPGRYVKVRAM